jgi:eukaryotic-like serine/threonine-protein kinase
MTGENGPAHRGSPAASEGGWVSDAAIDRLRALDDRPDFSATRYEVLDEIGRGGMGIVFRGRDRELAREVAIKVTAWSTAADAERLRQEARTLAALEHPGIVPIHDVGQVADRRVFVVMMLVRGERLDACAARLPLQDRLRLFDRICDTVSFAHARGVIHRDLKPANIMIGPFGQLLVLDWGLARPESDPGRDKSESDPSVDPVFSHGGTDGYMAPEQVRGIVDARSDVYALGAILDGLAGDSRSRLLRPLRSVIDCARRSDPGARYQDVATLAADVRQFVDGAAVSVHRETAFERTRRVVRVYRTPIALVLAYLVMRGLLLLWG